MSIPIANRCCLFLGIGAIVAGSVRIAAADEKRSTKDDLTPTSMRGLHLLIRPQADEWRHLKVNWITDVVAARKQAMKEDKPIVVLYTGGAGYNEPLGVC
jgi:hypothetical protein